MNTTMDQRYIDECKQIQQNATYSAETHHRMAVRDQHRAFWLQVIPACIAAGSGALVAAGVSPTSLLWLTVLSATVAAVSNILNPQKSYQDHLSAAKGFTALKHDARFLHEAQSSNMTDPEFRLATAYLHEKYNDLVKIVPPTDPKVFEQARITIQAGIHEPDRSLRGEIK
ncbi:MAG: SLATT domain-containing protein [Acidobacteriota bacterium]